MLSRAAGFDAWSALALAGPTSALLDVRAAYLFLVDADVGSPDSCLFVRLDIRLRLGPRLVLLHSVLQVPRQVAYASL
jgi:hypothetical protein